MISLIALLLIATVLLLSLVIAIMRYCLWRNRALLVIVLSAGYFCSIFMIFTYYGQALG